jgi:hypothetical protein
MTNYPPGCTHADVDRALGVDRQEQFEKWWEDMEYEWMDKKGDAAMEWDEDELWEAFENEESPENFVANFQDR